MLWQFLIMFCCPSYTFLFISYTILLLGSCQAAWCLPLVACSLQLRMILKWAFIRCDQFTYRKFLRHFYSTATHLLDPRSLGISQNTSRTLVAVTAQVIRAQVWSSQRGSRYCYHRYLSDFLNRLTPDPCSTLQRQFRSTGIRAQAGTEVYGLHLPPNIPD